ncbi:MAG: response regulator transcription factor [Pseudobacteriovorax sp.]|nr:response regulator transcription factor [Pseudobacteriovorax sp.]
MAKKRILMVDDSEIVTQDLQASIPENLKLYDFEFDVLHDGDSALEHIKKDLKYDLIILDWVMPGASGLMLASEIDKASNPPPILMLTSKFHDLEVTEGIESIKCWVLKPVRPDKLADTIERIWQLEKTA